MNSLRKLFSSRPQGGASTKEPEALRGWGAGDPGSAARGGAGPSRSSQALKPTRGGIGLVSPNLEDSEDRKEAEEDIEE